MKKILSIALQNHKPLLILIQGAPGSGKTTLAKELSLDFNLPFFEADQYFEDMYGNYEFNPFKLNEAHNYCKERTKNTLASSFSCIVSNTFTSDKELKYYYELDYEVFLIKMNTSFQTIHNVPTESIERMKRRLAQVTYKPNYICDL